MLNFSKKKESEPKSGGGCYYYNKFKKNQLTYETYGFKKPVWDIEDLVDLFKKKKVENNSDAYSKYISSIN